MTTLAFAPTEPAAPSPARASRPLTRLFRWRNTPERIRGLTALIIVLTIALGLIMSVIFSGIASGVRVIGSQAAPEVRATTDLYFRLNDMDARVANILLVGNSHDLGENLAQAEQTFARDRAAADRDLQQAAAAAGSDPSAQRALRTVLDGLGRYELLVGQVEYAEAAGPSKPGRPPAAALAAYRTATDLLTTGILPAARDLTAANGAALDATYQGRHSLALRGVIFVLIMGLALTGLLIGTQMFLSATQGSGLDHHHQPARVHPGHHRQRARHHRLDRPDPRGSRPGCPDPGPSRHPVKARRVPLIRQLRSRQSGHYRQTLCR